MAIWRTGQVEGCKENGKRWKKVRKTSITLKCGKILMEHIEPICSLESQLSFGSICSIEIRSRNRDIKNYCLLGFP